jgi:carboxylesterase
MTESGDIIYVIHGSNAHTWWRRLANGGYAWWRRWSLFCWELRRAIGRVCEIREFRWSGRNTHQARLEAGTRLAKIIASDSSGRKIHIVGHSHGGNVALTAVNQLQPHRAESVILLANPNIAVREADSSRRWLYWGEAAERVPRIWNLYSPQDIVQCRLVRLFHGIHDANRKDLLFQPTYESPSGKVQNRQILWAERLAAHRAMHSGSMGAVVGLLLRGETFDDALKGAGLSAEEPNAFQDRGGWPGIEQTQEMIRQRGDPRAFDFGAGGKDVAVLFVHGFTASPSEMRTMAEFMAQRTGWRCKGILLPGHGTRVEDLQDTRAEDWVRAAENAYEELAKDSRHVLLVGLSMGAVLCCHVASRRSGDSRLRGLILMAPAFGITPARALLLRLAAPVTNLRSKGKRAADYFLDHGLYSYLQTPLNRATDVLRLGREAASTMGELHNLPVLMFAGEKESTVSLKTMLSVAGDNPWIQLVKLPQSRHILTVEPDRENVFEASARFVEQCVRDF